MSDDIDHMAIALEHDRKIAERRKTAPTVERYGISKRRIVLHRDTDMIEIQHLLCIIGQTRHAINTLHHAAIDVNLNGFKLLESEGVDATVVPKAIGIVPISSRVKR